MKAFAAYLDIAAIRDQRLKDDPNDTTVRTYYHVVTNGIDFITLDNGSCDMFDDAQMAWLRKRARARRRRRIHPHDRRSACTPRFPTAAPAATAWATIRASRTPAARSTTLLLAMRDKSKKQVYVLASHSHFVMDNVYDSDYWRTNGGVLPGWIVGTSGAVRYRLPETATPGPNTRTDVYGYLLGTVSANGAITFEFRELTPKDIPADVVNKYSKNFVENFCFAANRDIAPQQGYCPPMSQCYAGRLTDQFRNSAHRHLRDPGRGRRPPRRACAAWRGAAPRARVPTGPAPLR